MSTKAKTTEANRTATMSTTERNYSDVPSPPARRLDIKDLFSNPSDPNDKPNIEMLKQHFILEGRLTEAAALRIIETGERN